MISKRKFPWKIGQKLFKTQILFFIIVFFSIGFSIRYHVYNIFSNPTDVAKAIGEFDSYLTKLFSLFLIISVFYYILITYKYLVPLNQLLKRAKEIKKNPNQKIELSAEDLRENHQGEWQDLERLLLMIHKDLMKKGQAIQTDKDELNAILTSVSDAIVSVGTSGEILFANTKFKENFGSNNSNLQSIRLMDLFRSAELSEALVEVFKSSQVKECLCWIRTLRSPTPRTFKVSISPLVDSKSMKVYSAVASFHDVTELKQAEQIRIEFVGNASHELKTPLTSIKAYVDQLKMEFQDKEYIGEVSRTRNDIEVISKNIERLIFLVRDLLDLSMIESGPDWKLQEVDLQEVLEHVIASQKDFISAKKLQIQFELNEKSIWAEPQRFEQVVTNLVQNAIRYIPENSLIKIKLLSPSKHENIFVVEDNGPGIASVHHERLFERFYRVDSGRTRDQGGTGLGLSIVKHIMLKHGGRVEVQSQLGEGAKFLCYFPKPNKIDSGLR